MSVDLSLIIPNNCQSLRDTQNAKKCFDDTINSVVKHFHGRKQFVTDIIISTNEEDPNYIKYSFEIPLLSITAEMHSGFWDTSSEYNSRDAFWILGYMAGGKL